MTAALAVGIGTLALLLVAVVGHHCGRRRGRVCLPVGIVAELSDHKLKCLGEAPERVALEIALLCATDRRSRRTAAR